MIELSPMELQLITLVRRMKAFERIEIKLENERKGPIMFTHHKRERYYMDENPLDKDFS